MDVDNSYNNNSNNRGVIVVSIQDGIPIDRSTIGEYWWQMVLNNNNLTRSLVVVTTHY